MRIEKINELKSYIKELGLSKIVRREYNDKPFLKTESYYCYLNDGSVIPRERIVKGNDYDGAVIIMPVTKEGEILVVIEPKPFVKSGVGIGFPAGSIESGEDIYEAGLRELREETGYVTDNIVLVDSYYEDEGSSRAYNHILIAYDCVKVGSQKLDNHEIIKYMLFSYDELFELEKMGYICGVNTKLLLSKSNKYMDEVNKDV